MKRGTSKPSAAASILKPGGSLSCTPSGRAMTVGPLFTDSLWNGGGSWGAWKAANTPPMASSIEIRKRVFIWVSLDRHRFSRPRILPSARPSGSGGSELHRPSGLRRFVDGGHDPEVPEAFLAGSERLGVVQHAFGEVVYLRREMVAHGLDPLLNRPPAQD